MTVFAGAFLIQLGTAASTYSQIVYPETLWVPVTFYDYHADGTNPNFEPAGYTESYAGRRYNMVQNYLDAERKPLWTGINFTFNDRIDEWWRPSGAGAEAVFSVSSGGHGEWSNLVPYQGRVGEYVSQNFDPNDPMACVVIYDSLPFILYDSLYTGFAPFNDASLLDQGIYLFDDQEFHPIDGRGFGAEPASYAAYNWTNTENHNFSFAMEIHRSFTYNGDLQFSFQGDDDVWCFVANQLMMDLGGIHGAILDSVSLSSMGLAQDQVYEFDFFYCERHVTGSHIRITTNVVSARPVGGVQIDAYPDDVIWVGEQVTLEVTVLDDQDQVRPDWEAQTQWFVVGDGTATGLSATSGSQVTYTGLAPGTYVIGGTACNPDNCAGTQKSDSITITVREPVPIRLEIAGNPPQDTIAAGVGYNLTAQVFTDRQPGGLHAPGLDPFTQWSWETVNADPGAASFQTPSGASNVFTATRAYDLYRIIGTFVDTGNASNVLRDTLLVYVKPGPAAQIVIEGDTVITDGELRDPSELDLVFMDSSTTEAYAVAVARDAYGNFVRLSNPDATAWNLVGAAIATVNPVATRAYYGHIQRLADGTTRVEAVEAGLTPDSVDVEITSGTVLAVRFIDTTTGLPVTAIDITTDDDLPLQLQVILSTNPGVWQNGTGAWTLTATSGTLEYAGAEPPAAGGFWRYSPTTPGTGQLCALSGGTQGCVDVNVVPAPPSSAYMTLLTPDSLRIAGETLLVEVRIENLDGPVPGQYCFGPPNTTPQALYADQLRSPDPLQPLPEVINDWGSAIVNASFVTGASTITQCFNNGVDTVKFVLYYAPLDQTPHVLSGQFQSPTGTLIASTQPFVLHPAALDHMDFTSDDKGQNVLSDTIRLGPEDFQIIFAMGYDRFGNVIGPTDSRWTRDNNLPPPTTATTDRLYIDATQISSDMQYNLTARSIVDTSKTTTALVIIQGPEPQVTRVLTLDTNSNGLLDAVQISTAGIVDLSAVDLATFQAGFDLSYFGSRWTYTGLIGQNGTMQDSVFILSLAEAHSDQPQTGWVPTYTVNNVPGLANQLVPVDSRDGAAPVIWRVVKIIDPNGDPTKDVYQVVFSEDAYSSTGSDISLFTPPESLFVAYQLQIDGTDSTYVPLDGIFLGVEGLTAVLDTTLPGTNDAVSMVEFRLDNGNTLYANHFLNIRTNPSVQVQDAAVPDPNQPTLDNQLVRVVPVGDPVFEPVAYPNPSGADPAAYDLEPGVLSAAHQEGVSNDLLYGEISGGFGVTFTIVVPDTLTCKEPIKVYRRIYDISGNLVNEAYEGDLLLTMQGGSIEIEGGKVIPVEMYWSGLNQKGMPVAPGVYREVLYLDYGCQSKQDQRGIVTYGVTSSK